MDTANHSRRGPVLPTTVLTSLRLSARLGVDVTLATETFQHTGSFKFRTAYNVAANVPHSRIIAASSGNFGQALAYACQLLGKSCRIVMPTTCAKTKIDATRGYGAEVDLIDTTKMSRAARVAELQRDYPDAYIASAYDDPLDIEGNATLGAEIAALKAGFDCVIAPIGGGGLTSGIITGLRGAGDQTPLIAAEPLMANDAARSLKAGRIVSNDGEPQTIADGARTVSVGKHNWEILRQQLAGVVEVSEAHIKEGVRLLYLLANLKAEPTAALAIGALLTKPDEFRGKRVCCVISGANVDMDVYREILASAG